MTAPLEAPARTAPRRGLRSARFRWVGIVIGLLVGNAVAVAFLIVASGGDTRRRVLPDYYPRAAAWDDHMAAEAASRRLGWSSEVEVHGRELIVRLRDRDGAPLSDARARIAALPRAHADEAVDAVLDAAGPGVYRGHVPGRRSGLHELSLVVERGADRWLEQRVIEVTGLP